MRLLKEIRNLIENYHVKSGVYHYYRSEYQQAVEFIRKALREDGDLTAADRYKATRYLSLSYTGAAEKRAREGDLEAAVEQFNLALGVTPEFPDIHFKLGGLLEKLDRRKEAIEAYSKAIEQNEDYLDARVALGFCLIETGELVQARTAFEYALAIKQKKIEEPFRLGIDLLDAGDTGQAVELFHQTFLSAPQLSDSIMRRALDKLHAGEYEEALEGFEKALFFNPKYPDLHNFRGVALYELERADEAIDAFELSAKLSPASLAPRLNLALALILGERYTDAEVILEEILAVEPTEPAARAKLDELRAGRFPEKKRPVPRGNKR